MICGEEPSSSFSITLFCNVRTTWGQREDNVRTTWGQREERLWVTNTGVSTAAWLSDRHERKENLQLSVQKWRILATEYLREKMTALGIDLTSTMCRPMSNIHPTSVCYRLSIIVSISSRCGESSFSPSQQKYLPSSTRVSLCSMPTNNNSDQYESTAETHRA